MFAQGDVLLIPVKPVKRLAAEGTKTAGERNPLVLAEGETTGHRHAFYSGAVMFRDDGLARAASVPSDLYIGHVVVAPGGAVLEHGVSQGLQGDHAPINVPAGTYIARRQMEFPLRESKRIVAD